MNTQTHYQMYMYGHACIIHERILKGFKHTCPDIQVDWVSG